MIIVSIGCLCLIVLVVNWLYGNIVSFQSLHSISRPSTNLRQRTARQAEYAENVAHLATQRDPALRDGVLTAMKMVMRQTHAATPHRLSWLE